MKNPLKKHNSYQAIPKREVGYASYLGEFMWRHRFERPAKKEDQWRRHSFWNLARALRAVHPLEAKNFHQFHFTDAELDCFGEIKAEFDGPKGRCLRGGPRGKREVSVFHGPIDNARCSTS